MHTQLLTHVHFTHTFSHANIPVDHMCGYTCVYTHINMPVGICAYTCMPLGYMCTCTHVCTQTNIPVGHMCVCTYVCTLTNMPVGHMCTYICMCVCTHTNTPVGYKFIPFLVLDLKWKQQQTCMNLGPSHAYVLQNGGAVYNRDSGSCPLGLSTLTCNAHATVALVGASFWAGHK